MANSCEGHQRYLARTYDSPSTIFAFQCMSNRSIRNTVQISPSAGDFVQQDNNFDNGVNK